MQHYFTTRTNLIASTAMALVALATFVAVALEPQQAVAQGPYTYKSGGARWGAVGRWTVNDGQPASEIPNAPDATAIFNLPMSSKNPPANPPDADFTMNMVDLIPDPGTITIGNMIINNTAGNIYNTFFGATGATPGELVFQVSSGSAAYTESAGDSNGGTTVRTIITLKSDLVVTQNHRNLAAANSGTTFSNLINAAPGIKFIKEGNANLNLSYAGTPGDGQGFYGSFEINQGAVRIVSNAHLQNAAGFTVKAGAQLQIGVAGNYSLADEGSLSLQGKGVNGGPTNNEGSLLFQMNAGATATFASPIVLGALPEGETTGDNIIRVQTNGGNNNSGAAVAVLSGPISGVAGDIGFLKTGIGSLFLAGDASNTYSGATGTTTAGAIPGNLYLDKSGGAIAVPGQLNVGGGAYVTVLQNEQIADNALVRFTGAPRDGTLRIGGEAFHAGNVQETVGAILSFNTNSGAIEANVEGADSVGTLTIAGTQTSKFDGVIRDYSNQQLVNPGKLAIAKTGAESLELTYGENTYSGGTTVSGGKLIVSNTSGSATGTGSVTVSGTGSLTGNGIVSGDVVLNAGGHVAPGTSAGILTVGSAAFNDPTAALDIEIGGTVLSPGFQEDFDQLAVTGAATLGGALNVSLINGFTPEIDDVFQILTTGSGVTGTFATTNLPALPSGSAWNVNYGSNYVELAVVAGPAGVLGDFNNDGKVDAADYVTWRKNDGANASLPNDNGAADQTTRFTLWRANFGNPPGSGSGNSLSEAAVPEPATAILAGVAMIGYLVSMRKR